MKLTLNESVQDKSNIKQIFSYSKQILVLREDFVITFLFRISITMISGDESLHFENRSYETVTFRLRVICILYVVFINIETIATRA